MTLSAKDVAEILRLLESSNFDSLSLEMNGVKLNLRRGSAAPERETASPSAASQPAAKAQSPRLEPPARKVAPPSQPGLAEITSPLLGIFYRAPKPGEPPFVEIGSKVNENTVVGIIEVMKLMNSVHAGVKGEIVEILAVNGTLVEYGDVVLRVRPEA